MKKQIETSNFIEEFVLEDKKKLRLKKIITRFPPEPNGFLHIGHAKAMSISFLTSKKFGGYTNLRMDDTNPAKETMEFVENIKRDVEWLGFHWKHFKFASSYYGKLYRNAKKLIKKGKAYVCDLTADQIRETRGTLTEPGTNSPYRDRSVEENLTLFKQMKKGVFADGEKVLRAKIDMASSNINMRDPVIYRISRQHHFRTKDKWVIYPMYDYAHPLSDAFEGITHSLCDVNFEDHRPLYDWVVTESGYVGKHKPRQIEFSKLNIENVILGKRYIRKLIEQGLVDGYSDPRLLTVQGMRRRGYSPEAIVDFVTRVGVTKADSMVEFQYLEHCVRENLNKHATRIMAVLNPLKVTITNYPVGRREAVEVENNPNDKKQGYHEALFEKEIYIERDDFNQNPPKGYHRLTPDGYVRLKGAYIIKCEQVVTNNDGEVVEIVATYLPNSKSGNDTSGLKVKGVVQWVNANDCVNATIHTYGPLVKLGAEFNGENLEEVFNRESKMVNTNAKIEPYVLKVPAGKQMQFMRNGYFVKDSKNSENVYINTVNLKDSFKPSENN